MALINNLVRASSEGTLTAALTFDENTARHKLLWFVNVPLNYVHSTEGSQGFSIVVEQIEDLLPVSLNWMDLKEAEFCGKNHASFYDGTHHPTHRIYLKFLDRDKNKFKVQLSINFTCDSIGVSSIPKGSLELNLDTWVIFKGLIIPENSSFHHENFMDPIWLLDFASQYINTQTLEGPFYPFPPVEPYSKNSWAEFEPKLSV